MKIKNLFTHACLISVFTVCLLSSFGAAEPAAPLNAHLKQGNLYFCQAKYDDAIAEFEKAVAEDPDDVYANTNLAYTYYITGKYDAAIKQWERVTQVSPNNGIAYDFMAQIYKDDFLNKEGGWYNYGYGRCASDECAQMMDSFDLKRVNVDPNYDESIKFYTLAVIQDAKDAIAEHLLALSTYNKGFDELALYHLKKSLEGAPQNVGAMLSLAQIYDAQDEQSKALTTLYKILGMQPKNVKALYFYAGLKINQGFKLASRYLNYDAISAYKRMLSYGIESEEIYFGLALASYSLASQKKGDKYSYDLPGLRQSFDYCEKWLTFGLPRYKNAKRYHVGFTISPYYYDPDIMAFAKNIKKNDESAKKGNLIETFLDKAKLVIEERVKQNGMQLYDKLWFIVFNIADGNYDEAIKVAGDIKSKYPEFTSSYDELLGDIAYEKGNFNDAIKYFRLALKDEPSWESMTGNIGMASLRSGKIKEAIPYLSKAYEERYYGFDYAEIYEVLDKNNALPFLKTENMLKKEDNGTPVGADTENYCEILKMAGYSCQISYLWRVRKPKSISGIVKSLYQKKMVVVESPRYYNFEVLLDYVKDGGRVLFLVNRWTDDGALRNLSLLNITLSSMTYIGGRSFRYAKWLSVPVNSSHPIFKGLQEFYVSGAAEIIADDVNVLAKVGDAPIIVEKLYGKGKFIVAAIGTRNNFDPKWAMWKKKDEKIVRSRLKLLLNMVAYLAKD